MSQYYPETMLKMFLVNTPRVFPMIWKVRAYPHFVNKWRTTDLLLLRTYLLACVLVYLFITCLLADLLLLAA